MEEQTGYKLGKEYFKAVYCHPATTMAESEEELKSLLIKVKEESDKASLKLNIQKMKIMANRWETMETLYLEGLQNHCRW